MHCRGIVSALIAAVLIAGGVVASSARTRSAGKTST